jgi:hypothetical protein
VLSRASGDLPPWLAVFLMSTILTSPIDYSQISPAA